MTPLNRPLPVRLCLVALGVLAALTAPRLGVSDEVVLAVVALVGSAILGDSYRPSGRARP